MVRKGCLLVVGVLWLHMMAVGQQVKDTISMSFENLPLEIILDSISYKSGYSFSYNADIMPEGSLYTLKRQDIAVSDLMNTLLIGTDLVYSTRDDQVILRKKNPGTAEVKSLNASSVSGWVRNHVTKEPIVGAHVFINGSTIGTTTDKYGNYRIYNIPKGYFQLVFSHVGYDLAAYQMDANEPAAHKVNASLFEEINLLKGIEVTSLPLVDDEDWIRYFREFSNQFIGNAANASKCKFLNPEVLEFARSDSAKTYEATASEPLVMQNDGLGYRVYFNLNSFRSSPKEMRFHVQARFENLEPPNRRVRKRWKRSRLRSYRGSRFHFMRALMTDEQRSEGFRMYRVDDLDNPINIRGASLDAKDILVNGDNNSKYLKFAGYLVVIYDKETQSQRYLQELSESNVKQTPSSGSVSVVGTDVASYQQSILKLDTTLVKVMPNGQILAPEDISTYGYWSWERMSELMPIDYDPRSDNFE